MGGKKKNTRVPEVRNEVRPEGARRNRNGSDLDLISVGNESVSSEPSYNNSFFRRPSGASNEDQEIDLSKPTEENKLDLIYDLDYDNGGMKENDSEDEKEESFIISTSDKPKKEEPERGQGGGSGADRERVNLLKQKEKEKEKPVDVSDWVMVKPDEDPMAEEAPGLDIEPVREKRHKQNFFSRMHDDLTEIAGATTGTLVTLGTLPILAPYVYKGTHALKKAKKKMADKRDHDTIPGWGGAKFYKKKDETGEDVLKDFRRVPTVWSYVTAGKAQDSKGEPLKPEISIYISQPKAGSSQSMVGDEIGHAMVGLHFSRFSKITGQYERYGLKYGFYPAGGFTTDMGGGTMASTRDAIVPGEMKDDRSHSYDISRTYPATQKQVNDIAKASETYADKGYGYFKRNCTTFVKEMIVDTAHLDTGGGIFQQERIRWTAATNVLRWLGETGSFYMASNFRSNMARRSKGDDLTYQGYGNKRVTKQDVDQFEKSYGGTTSTVKTGYIPAATGENLRRKYGKNAGRLGSMEYMGALGSSFDKSVISFAGLKKEIGDSGEALMNAITPILPEHYRNPENLPEEFQEIYYSLGAMGSPMGDLARIFSDYVTKHDLPGDTDEKKTMSPKQVKDAYAELTDNINTVNKFYVKYLRSDSRVNKEVMNMLSLMEASRNYLNTIYATMEDTRAVKAQGDLGNIRAELTQKSYEVQAGDVKAKFTPTHYESYVQIYKDPKVAVRSYARYLELTEKKKAEEELTDAETKELDNLARMEALADEFDKSHRYLLEKDAFSQRDIDYAFSLRTKEKRGVSGRLVDEGRTTASAYRLLFLEKIFGGLRQRYTDAKEPGGLTEKMVQSGKSKAIQKSLKKWIDKDLTACIQKKKAGMGMIVKGIYRSAENHTAKTLETYVGDLIARSYLNRTFREGVSFSDNKSAAAGIYMIPAFEEVKKDSKSGFVKILREVIAQVLREAK